MIRDLADEFRIAWPYYTIAAFLLAAFLTGHELGVAWERLTDAYAVISTDGGPKVVLER